MRDYGPLIYADARRWLLDDGDTLTEIEFCVSLFHWWRITPHVGRKRAIILACLARAQAENGLAPASAPDEGPPAADPSSPEQDAFWPPARPARAAPLDRRRRAQERRIAGL
jgi:hypothetical protein